MYTKRVQVARKPRSILSLLGLGSAGKPEGDYYQSPPIIAITPPESDARFTPYGAMTATAVMSPPFVAPSQSPPLIAITPSGSPVLSAPPAGPAIDPATSAPAPLPNASVDLSVPPVVLFGLAVLAGYYYFGRNA